MISVKATREGLIGHKTTSGYIIDTHVPFVALPAVDAVTKFIRLHNPTNNRWALAVVLDVGPWNTRDNDYVFRHARPQAESGVDSFGRTTNGAGIDLGELVWSQLRMLDNGEVEWEFVEPGPPAPMLAH